MNNDFYRQIVDSLEDYAILTTDIEGYISSWNSGAENILGYSQAEIIGKNAEVIFTSEDRLQADPSAELRRALKDGRANDEKWYRREDGTTFWGSGLVFPLKNKKGAVVGFTKIIHDLTAQKSLNEKADAERQDRKQAEQELRYQRSLLEAQQEASPHGELIVSAEGKTLSSNRRFAEMWRFPEKVTNSKIDDDALRAAQQQLVDPDGFIKRVLELYKNRRKSHEKLYFKDGRVFDRHGSPIINEDGAYYGYVWFFRDISDQEASEKALKDSEERLRFMAESMPQKIFTATADGSIDYFNPQWVAYTGLSFEKIRDWGWLQFIHPDDVDDNVRLWKHSVKTGEPFQLEHRFRQADGEYRWHLSRAHALKDASGSIIMWIGSNTDIEDFRRTTERKLELEDIAVVLREQQTQLVTLNDAKDEFIALASHQLRTPATGVKQYTGMLLEGYAGNVTDEQRDMLERVYDSNERQLTIVNDLLNVARVDAGKVRLNRSSFDIVQVVSDVLQEQAAKFSTRRQKLIFNKPEGASDIDVHADKALMRMVLENLIDNAGKYSQEGKTISVCLRQTALQTEIYIEDKGVGISKTDQARLFQKFTRIDNPLSAAVSGSGLGLYWAKEIIDLHQGELTVTSRSRTGSTFTVKLPNIVQDEVAVLPLNNSPASKYLTRADALVSSNK